MRPALALLIAVSVVGSASAAWQPGTNGSSAAGAKTLPAGNVPNQPTAALGSVTVSWAASTFADGTNVPAYVVRRYNALTSAEAAVQAGCSGLVTATTCTENGVSPGTWTYTVTPAAGNWRGTQSGQSPSVLVL